MCLQLCECHTDGGVPVCGLCVAGESADCPVEQDPGQCGRDHGQTLPDEAGLHPGLARIKPQTDELLQY